MSLFSDKGLKQRGIAKCKYLGRHLEQGEIVKCKIVVTKWDGDL